MRHLLLAIVLLGTTVSCQTHGSASVGTHDRGVVAEGVIINPSHSVQPDIWRCVGGFNGIRMTKVVCAPYTGPAAIRQVGVPTGMSSGAFWTSLLAGAVAVASQEWAMGRAEGLLVDARLGHLYQPSYGTRLRNGLLNLGPTLGLKWAGDKWHWRRDALDAGTPGNVFVAGMAVWRNAADVRALDRLLASRHAQPLGLPSVSGLEGGR